MYLDTDSHPRTVVVACDECDDGRALVAMRRDAEDDSKPKRRYRVGTLSQYAAQLDRESRAGSGVQWCVDPGWIEREPMRDHEMLRARQADAVRGAP